jgi:TonB family protein
MFELLDTRSSRSKSTFGTSILLHVLGIIVVIFSVGYARLDKRLPEHVWLVAPPPIAEYKPEPVVRRVPPPPPRRIEQPSKIEVAATPVIRPVERAPEPVRPAAPVVKTNVFTTPAKAEAPREMAMVRQNVFASQPNNSTERAAGQVKATGFGAPATLVKPVAGMPGEVAVGNFFHGVPGGPPGRTQGGGEPVSIGGFGSGGTSNNGASNGGAGGNGRVTTGGFGAAALAAQPVARVQRPAETPVTPVEILSKPSPSYTEEARRMKVEGVVLVQVTFLASGEVRVMGVVRGLGHGLDQSAVEAVRKIRFRAAKQEGRPVDSVGEVEIRFQLAS